jgi:hypothetical protein
MLLDEPFAALDPLTRDRLQRSLYDLQRRLIFICRGTYSCSTMIRRSGASNPRSCSTGQ